MGSVGSRTGARSPQPREQCSRVRARACARSHSAHVCARIGGLDPRAAACGTARLCGRVHGDGGVDSDDDGDGGVGSEDDDDCADEDDADYFADIGSTHDDGYSGDGDVVRTDGKACTPTFWYIIAMIRRAGTVLASLCNN